MSQWRVTLSGKWGGVRAITVSARTEATARKRAREQAYSYETISTVGKL